MLSKETKATQLLRKKTVEMEAARKNTRSDLKKNKNQTHKQKNPQGVRRKEAMKEVWYRKGAGSEVSDMKLKGWAS